MPCQELEIYCLENETFKIFEQRSFAKTGNLCNSVYNVMRVVLMGN